MATMVRSFAIQGIDGYAVDIEVTTLDVSLCCQLLVWVIRQ